MAAHRLVIATHNSGKRVEFERLLKPQGINCLSLADFNATPVEEPFDTFIENALHKARCASALTGLPALADDSGLCVPALNGAPGVRSARYAPADTQAMLPQDLRNTQHLLLTLQGVQSRAGFYYAVWVSLNHPEDPCPLIAHGSWWGEIATSPSGTQGFGYDPIFRLPSLGCTAAQLAPEVKDQLSHRGQAARQWLSAWQAAQPPHQLESA